jgi:hypothetical protein
MSKSEAKKDQKDDPLVGLAVEIAAPNGGHTTGALTPAGAKTIRKALGRH